MLQAPGRGAAGPRVVRRLPPPVVARVDVAPKLDEHLDEVHVLHLGRVVQCRLMELRRIHVGPCGGSGVGSKIAKEHGHESSSPSPESQSTLCGRWKRGCAEPGAGVEGSVAGGGVAGEGTKTTNPH